MSELPITIWLQLLVVGAIAGCAGQVLRTIVGLKKLNDDAAATPNVDVAEMIVPSRLVVSLIIGAAAGALAAMMFEPPLVGGVLNASRDHLFGFAAAGYAGTDFIEGFMRRVIPGAATKTAEAKAADKEAAATKTDSEEAQG